MSYDLPQDSQRSTGGSLGSFPHLEFIPGLSPKSASSVKIGWDVDVVFYDKPLSEKSIAQKLVLSNGQEYSSLVAIPYTGDPEEGWNNKIVSMEFTILEGVR